jgi:hypothetical protein
MCRTKGRAQAGKTQFYGPCGENRVELTSTWGNGCGDVLNRPLEPDLIITKQQQLPVWEKGLGCCHQLHPLRWGEDVARTRHCAR